MSRRTEEIHSAGLGHAGTQGEGFRSGKNSMNKTWNLQSLFKKKSLEKHYCTLAMYWTRYNMCDLSAFSPDPVTLTPLHVPFYRWGSQSPEWCICLPKAKEPAGGKAGIQGQASGFRKSGWWKGTPGGEKREIHGGGATR